ncbi:MAG: hypothetical protein SGARI_000068 [Bacillariaceae sp.]
MKFSTALSALFVGSGVVVDAMTIRGTSTSASTLMQKARRIEENNQYQQYYYQGDANNYYDGQQDGQAEGQNGEDYYAEMDEDSMWFLQGYSIYLLSCIQGERVVNYQDDEKSIEGSTVIFRLCPIDTCDAESSEFGCQEGYGDFAVGINTFVGAYLEAQQELYGNELTYYSNMGEEFVVNDYAECAERMDSSSKAKTDTTTRITNKTVNTMASTMVNNKTMANSRTAMEMDTNKVTMDTSNSKMATATSSNKVTMDTKANTNKMATVTSSSKLVMDTKADTKMAYYNANQDASDGGNRKLQDNYYQWYIGPGCTDDGKDINFKLYRDEYCSYAPGTKLQDITYGWGNGMPFEDGGLIPNMCHQCAIRDQDYSMQLTSFCADPFRAAVTRCEANMTVYSYMGANMNGCDYITNLEYSIFGDSIAIYGDNSTDVASSNSTNMTLSDLWKHDDETWEEAGLRFMDRMNTRQTRAFIAAMVLFCVSACIGASLITCMCFKKRRARKRARALVNNKDVYQGGNAVPMKKQQSGFVDLVRSSSKRVSEAVASAAIGTQVAVATAAAAVTRSSSKKAAAEASEYANMEDDIEEPAEGSYSAPAATSASVKSKKSTATEKTATSEKADKAVPSEILTENKEAATSSSGGVLEWFGLSKSAEKTEDKEVEKEDEKSTKEDASDSNASPSVAASSQKDLTSQMDDYFSEKFT